MGVTRPTATSYLNQLVGAGFLTEMKLGRDNFYLNMKLLDLLINAFRFDGADSGGAETAMVG